MKKVYIKTFGCQMNEYDSDKMADVLRVSDGLSPTDNPAEAERLASDLRGLLGISTIPLLAVGAAITTHAGPGTIGVGFFV